MLTYYQTLEVSRTADLGVIRKAYHRISLLCHPDKTVHLPSAERNQREQLFKRANVAFEVLSDHQKRKAYDQDNHLGQGPPQAQNNAARNASPYGQAPDDQQYKYDRRRGQDTPPRSTAGDARDARGFRSSQGLQRAPSSTHRFTASTLGKAPDFQWYHCQLHEYNKQTTLTYSNWLGWSLSVSVANHFKVTASPVIPQKPITESIVIRLLLLRNASNAPRAPNDVAIDLRGVPGNEHAILCSALVETQAAGLELVIELAVASATAQSGAQGSSAWKWTYNIDQEPLAPTQQARVTNMLFYPYMPFMAVTATGGMPAPPYPEESPMRGLLTQFPGINIEDSASNNYCVKEEQQGKLMWRLTAVGSM